MLTRIRSILFMIWLYGWIVILGLFWSPAFLLPRRFTVYGMRSWAAVTRFGLRWICGVRTIVRGKENLPAGACLVASKHQSMYDVLMPFLFLKDPAYILKRELLFYPIFGWYAWKSAMIPINRGGYVKTLKTMLARAKHEADRGRQVVIFPEGTRRLPGAPPEYKSGVFAMYKELERPCVPVALITGNCWSRKGVDRHPGTTIFQILPPIEAGLPREEFMRKLQDAIEPAADDLLKEVGAEPTGRAAVAAPTSVKEETPA